MSYTADQITSSTWRILGVTALLALLPACGGLAPDESQPLNPDQGLLSLPDGQRINVAWDALDYTGNATYTWPSGRMQTGWFEQGRLHGLGEEHTATDTYVGQWRHGQRHGHGELTRNDGTRYVGDFATGKPHGAGTQTSPQGVYTGQWRMGAFDGQGQLKTNSGAVYDGQWHQSLRQGYGYQADIDGSFYQGAWLANRRHGFGRQRAADGTIYEGHWHEGARNGYGELSTAAGVTYAGTWKDGLRHGFGEEATPVGNTYKGNWIADQRSGEGVEYHADGSRHQGLWENGRIAGAGTRLTASGLRLTGIWLGNRISSGTLELPSGASYHGALFSQDGEVVERELLTWLTNTSNADDPHAQYLLGTAYLDFASPRPDVNIAMRWLDKAATHGHAYAQYRLAQLLLNSDVSLALELLQAAADQQHPEANAMLGEFRHAGQYLQQDLSLAVRHYEAAHSSGNTAATNNLAWLLATSNDDAVADPQRSLELIRPLAIMFEHWQYLDTLAAAHARLGETDLAARMQRQAIDQAQHAADQDLLTAMQGRLAMYEAALPYIE